MFLPLSLSYVKQLTGSSENEPSDRYIHGGGGSSHWGGGVKLSHWGWGQVRSLGGGEGQVKLFEGQVKLLGSQVKLFWWGV